MPPALWALQSLEPALFMKRARWKKAILSLSRKGLSPVGVKGGEHFEQKVSLGQRKEFITEKTQGGLQTLSWASPLSCVSHRGPMRGFWKCILT